MGLGVVGVVFGWLFFGGIVCLWGWWLVLGVIMASVFRVWMFFVVAIGLVFLGGVFCLFGFVGLTAVRFGVSVALGFWLFGDFRSSFCFWFVVVWLC